MTFRNFENIESDALRMVARTGASLQAHASNPRADAETVLKAAEQVVKLAQLELKEHRDATANRN